MVSASVFGRRNVMVAEPSGRCSTWRHVNAAASETRAKQSRMVRNIRIQSICVNTPYTDTSALALGQTVEGDYESRMTSAHPYVGA